MNLVIVESPAKGKTIEKYLGKDYKVLASFGHVRDLPQKTLGVDLKNDFEPTYEIPLKSQKTVKSLKNEASKADTVYLATDYDREGEAIAWHIVKAIGLDKSKAHKENVKRIAFHEITEPAIKEAISHPREINLKLVDAQQARRILDRLVGYKLSPFLWKKVARGLSAGRVQSVAVRLIVEKEKEIEKFQSVTYFQIEAILSKDGKSFRAGLSEVSGKKLEKLALKSKAEAEKIIKELENSEYKVEEAYEKESKRYPSPPFTTSSLQQEAASRLGYSAKQTMRLAQNLYEKGLITYMRTDSVNVSSLAQKQAQEIISNKYGKNYALSVPRFFKTKTRNAQEAHEAIRPTNLKVEKDSIEPKEQKLYDLIWRKMVASQMKEAEILEKNVKISAGKHGLSARGAKLKFDGFLRLGNTLKEEILPDLKEGDELKLEKLENIEKKTEPPARYTEGTLVKELEKRGIGRPSTYAPTIATVQDRGYVEKIEGKLKPKEMGSVVNDLLVDHFPEVVDYDFTAKMEEDLDEIAEGKLKWQPVIGEFYTPFSKKLKEKIENVEKSEVQEKTDEKCPDCGKDLKIKLGRYGKFLACTGFPECKFTKPYLNGIDGKTQAKASLSKEKCPKCGKNLLLKEGRFGQFLACGGYPECKFTKNIESGISIKCPNCDGKLVQKRTGKGKTFWGCDSFPKCKTAFWNEPTDQLCPECGKTLLKIGKSEKLKCSECEYKN